MDDQALIHQRSNGSVRLARGLGVRSFLARQRFVQWAMMLLVLSNFCSAETLRVTTWNLAIGTNTDTTAELLQEAAATLKSLDPDVILLQRVQDWRMCGQLAEALKPLAYNVLICSAFRRVAPTMPPDQQVAILSKRKAYFTWSDTWPSQEEMLSRGVALAAIQTGSQRVGLFTALGDQRSGEEVAQRLLGEIDSIRHWETNQVDTVVIAASFDPWSRKSAKGLHEAFLAFEKAGYVDATEQMPAELKATLRSTTGRAGGIADCLFAGPMGFPSNTHITASPATDHYPITSDIELDPDKVTTALDLRAEERRQNGAGTSLVTGTIQNWAGGVAVLGLAIVAALWFASKKRTRDAVRPRNGLPVRATGLPVRATRRNAPSPLRPIVFAQPPAKPRVSEQSGLPHARSPIRLQVTPRKTAQPTTQEPPALPPAPNAKDSDGPPPKAAIVRQDVEVRQGVIKELSGWLKQKLVRKLVTDRAQLMEAQQLATRMATTLDDRLARIEAQIQRQNQAYVRRIEELNQELAAAREENRELIRERIAQVKAEMEAARDRVLAEANLDSTSLRL